MQFEKFVPSAEINSIQKNIKVKNEGVEIFSAICAGKDLTKYGDKVDKVMAYMKDLGKKAEAGNTKAQAEINAIREIQIQAPLVKRLNIFTYIGDYQSVGYNEELRYKVYQLQGKMAGKQASGGSFAFPTQTWREESLSTKTITGGMAIDYREYASGNVDSLGVMQEQVVTDMFNQMFYDVVYNMYNSVKTIAAAGGLTVSSEAAGINKTVVDDALKLIRRWGRPTIFGDYSVISQMEDFARFNTNSGGTTFQLSEAVMEEIRQTGLLKNYRGTPVVEIPNAYNLTKIEEDAGIGGSSDYFGTMLPEGLLFITPKTNFSSPLQVGIKGGITSLSGVDLNLGINAQRFDIEFGSTVIKEYVPMLGLISDENFSVDKK
jgi:hypothetical protein